MTDILIPHRRQERRGTLADAIALNEVLRDGELFIVRDVTTSTGLALMKIGDGITAFNDLDWFGIGTQPDPGEDRFAWWNDALKEYELKRILPAPNGGTGQTTYTIGALLYAASSSVLSQLAAGAAGYVLQSAGTGAAPFWAPSGASGGLTFLGTATVSGSDATTLTLSGLDLGAYKSFYIEVSLKNATGSASTVSLYYNSDTTATNYDRQTLPASSTTSSPTRGNDGQILPMAATTGTITATIAIIKDQDSKPRAIINYNRDTPAAIITALVAHVRDNTANVTSITLSASVASSLKIGSTMTVWGRT